MKDVYIIKVDKICNYCGYKNEINTVVYHPVDIIACGRCGEYILIPDDIPPQEKKELSKMINKAIQGDM